MTFKEAVLNFDNSRRKMAYALDLSIQAVGKWAKHPDKPIPQKRVQQIEQYLQK